MNIQIRKAERFKSKLRLGLAGPSGAGKTMSALKLAHGLVGDKGRILMIDTERGSGDLYAHLFNYDIISLTPPYKPSAYVDALKAGIDAGYDVIILDSLSHAWADEGGLLDQADKLSAKGNRFTVWADLTPQHRALVNGMLNAPCHIVATIRSKQSYEMEEYQDSHGNKKTRPVKIGLAPVQREGMEYEFTVFMDIDQQHNARASKDRTNMFKDEIFLIEESTGQRIMGWLNEGRDNPAAVIEEKKKKIWKLMKELDLNPKTAEEANGLIKGATMLDLVEANYDAILEKLTAVRDNRLRAAADNAKGKPEPVKPMTQEKAKEIVEKSEPLLDRDQQQKISTGQLKVLKGLLEDKTGFDPEDPEAVKGYLSLTDKIPAGVERLEDLTLPEAKLIIEDLMKQNSLPDDDVK